MTISATFTFAIRVSISIATISAATTAHAQHSELHAKVVALRPAAEAWQKIEWRTDLQTARRQADTAQKPIFLWAMNGNPLGCT